MLTNGTVKNIISRDYVIKAFVAHTATVYLKDPSWSTVYFYAWTNDGKNTQLLGGWPGTATTATTTINGQKWYYRSFDINASDYSFNIIFDQGKDKMQTVDIGPISEDKFYEPWRSVQWQIHHQRLDQQCHRYHCLPSRQSAAQTTLGTPSPACVLTTNPHSMACISIRARKS